VGFSVGYTGFRAQAFVVPLRLGSERLEYTAARSMVWRPGLLLSRRILRCNVSVRVGGIRSGVVTI